MTKKKQTYFFNPDIRSELPKPGFPIIFEGIVGQDRRDANSPSYYNIEEAVVVVQYLEKLLRLCQAGIEKVGDWNILTIGKDLRDFSWQFYIFYERT
jgi:hypothetical protein